MPATSARPLELHRDPRAFVISRNLHRRHLTGSQRAAAIVACGNWRAADVVGKPTNRSDSQGTGEVTSPVTLTNDEMATEAKVSKKTIKHAKAATAAGLNQLVSDGTLTAERAAQIAKLPLSEREKAIADLSFPLYGMI